jgi:hypothetical protein
LDFVWAEARTSGNCHCYLVGTRAFSSSNQFSTTSIFVGA